MIKLTFQSLKQEKENIQSQGFQNVHNKRCHLNWDWLSSKFECIFTLSGMKWFFPFFLDLTDVWKIPCGKLRCKKIWKTSTRLKDKKGCENPDELTRLWHQRCCFRQRRIQPCRRNPCGRQSRRWLSRGSKCQLLGRSIPSPAGKTSFEAIIWSLWK